MTNQELLQRLETSHQWQANAILKLRDLVKNEDKFTQQATNDIRSDVLTHVQLTISEMLILQIELERVKNE